MQGKQFIYELLFIVLTKNMKTIERRIKSIEPIKNVNEILKKTVIGKMKIGDRNWPINLKVLSFPIA